MCVFVCVGRGVSCAAHYCVMGCLSSYLPVRHMRPRNSRRMREAQTELVYFFIRVCFNTVRDLWRVLRSFALHLDLDNVKRRAGFCAAQCLFVMCIMFPTRISVSPESTVPDNKATSCSVNVRGEEKCCILGIIQEHRAWRDTAAENPCKRRQRIRQDRSVMSFSLLCMCLICLRSHMSPSNSWFLEANLVLASIKWFWDKEIVVS